jgi:transposase
MRYELADHEWAPIKPMLPNKPRGVPRVNDRRTLNGIFWVLRTRAPWRELPDAFGPYTTCYNRFVRWRRAGVWSRIIDALAAAHDAAVQIIDTSIVRVHQHAACITRNRGPWDDVTGLKDPVVGHRSKRLFFPGRLSQRAVLRTKSIRRCAAARLA